MLSFLGTNPGYSSQSSVSWLLASGTSSTSNPLHGAPFVDVLSALTRNVGSTALMNPSQIPCGANGMYYNSTIPNRYQDCSKSMTVADAQGQNMRMAQNPQDCRTRRANTPSSDNIIASLWRHECERLLYSVHILNEFNRQIYTHGLHVAMDEYIQ